MSIKRLHAVLAATAIFALAGCNNPSTATNSSAETSNAAAASTHPVASAESAAPAAIAHDAAVVTMDASGKLTTVRAGKNGWTCMPDTPTTPGPDPMCWDANAGKWLTAYLGHKPPPADAVGIIYMLAGGSDPGNTDPYADKPHPGENWVATGPHIMVVGSKEILAGYPPQTKPDTKVPYVMWAGTPYAHLMVPVKQ